MFNKIKPHFLYLHTDILEEIFSTSEYSLSDKLHHQSGVSWVPY